MSFIAYCEKEHINKKRAEDVTPNEQNDTFYCQNTRCNCEFSVSALNSNKVRTHFVKKPSSQHIEGCWNDINLKESGSKNDYDTSDFSLNGLLDIIKNANDKKPNDIVKKPVFPKTSPTEHKKEMLYIHTVRELFAVCLMNDIDDEINGIKIKEIFAGQITESEIERIPTFKKGECILAINGYKNIKLNIEITDKEKKLFAGGA